MGVRHRFLKHCTLLESLLSFLFPSFFSDHLTIYLELTSASEAEIKKAISEGLYLDYVVKDGLFYVTLMSTIKDNMDKVC